MFEWIFTSQLNEDLRDSPVNTELPLPGTNLQHSSEVAYYAGVIFNYRLTFGLVTAIFGLERDIITPEMVNTILLCFLFSSLAATHFKKKEKVKATWRWARDLARERYGKRKEVHRSY